MNLTDAYREDLRELVAALDDVGVFRPGEREAWEEGIEEADHCSDLMVTNTALMESLGDRDGFNEALDRISYSPTGAYV